MNFDYHVMWKTRVVDRATTLKIAERVCEERGETLGRAFRDRTLSILHVPSNTVLARHNTSRGGFLPAVPRRGGNFKLTEGQVLTIRQRRAAGEKVKDLAEEFGVAAGSISRVSLHGWSSLEEST